nr:methyltransferase dimerization domain-containing protein [uncultured Steroidobacter sp.]
MPESTDGVAHIMQVGFGFWPSKVLLTAVELEVFTTLGASSMTGEELGRALGLHPRGIWDFLDALTALGFLEREGSGVEGRYRNTSSTAQFLDKSSPAYIGGILEMCNQRLFRFWADLGEALKNGQAAERSEVQRQVDVRNTICGRGAAGAIRPCHARYIRS